MSFEVIVTRDFDHMSEEAARIVIDAIRGTIQEKGGMVLGLATGNTPTGLYKHLAKAANGGAFDPACIRSFNLDEYVGLPGENAQQRAMHPESYSFFMVQELFGLLGRKFAETNVPWGTLVDQDVLREALAAHPGDWSEEGSDKGRAVVIRRDADSGTLRWLRREILDAYAAKIAAAGGVDLHIVGVGGRGHVAFHEAGIPFAGNRMLLVRLDDNTVDNAVADGHFPRRDASPRFAISMGAELVYEARTVLLLANGARKAEPVAESLLVDPTPAIPISYGQLHARRGGRVIYVVDREAAEGILARADDVRRRGIVVTDRSDGRAVRRAGDLAFARNPASGRLE